VLRDEQIYLAHKAANPASYPPCDEILTHNGQKYEDVTKYPPTDVQLLVFDNGAHAAPTVGHTRGLSIGLLVSLLLGLWIGRRVWRVWRWGASL
jgi:hypothetical protein